MMSAAPPTMAYSWRAAQKLDAALLQTHVLKHFAARWFDRNEISARFPPIAGFRILWLSSFFFSCAWVGFFMGWRRCSCRSRRKLTNGYEARPYGVDLGLCGLMPAISIPTVNKRKVDLHVGY